MFELTVLKPKEKSRIYYFDNGNRLELDGVTHFMATESTHRLKTSDGKLRIVPRNGWFHIEIEVDEFTL